MAVTVIARFKAKPGCEEQVRLELMKLLGSTRLEDGCLNYDLHQGSTDHTLFLFHENWTSEEALQKHFASVHIQAWLKIAESLLEEPLDLSLWQRVGR